MTDQEVIDEAATAAFKALRSKARAEHGGNTQPLLVVYAVESFLRRLAASEHAQRMVLKGGMLMTANGIRRMTKDADPSNTRRHQREGQRPGCRRRDLRPDTNPHDGVIVDRSTIRTEVMREDDEYQGVRCKLVANLGQARVPFALDFSFGDMDRSTTITLRSIIDQPAVQLQAYPLALNLAEKIVTAMQRRETSTRDRDFADLWVTSRLHRLDASELRGDVLAVANHRQQPAISVAEALMNMPDRQQPYEAMVARMSYLSPPAALWTELIGGVIDFVDPLLSDEDDSLSYWDPEQLQWVARPAEKPEASHSSAPSRN